MAKKEKKPAPPFPIDNQYPSGISKLSLNLYNGLYNALFPVRPWVFGASAVGIYAYFHRNPSSQILNLIPNPLNYDIPNIMKLSLVSLSVAYTPVFLLRLFLKYYIFSYKGFLFEKKPSWKTKIWALFRKLLVRNPRLNSCDALLPNLPVPDLKETVKNYLESMEEILPKDEFKNVSELAEKFLKEEGWKLQILAKLLRTVRSNYVTPFWEKYAYLMGRDQLMISSSVSHADIYKDIKANQAVRAAHVIYTEALSMLAIYKQKLKPLGDGLVCSEYYHRMYAGTRVPGEHIDHLESHRLSKHAVIYCNGCFYKIDVFDERGKVHSVEHFCDIFTELITRKDKPILGEERLAAFTFDQRTTWAKNRERFFLQNKINKESLKIIETAMVFMNFDPYDLTYDLNDPKSLDVFLKQMLTGDGKNRWADKPFNYIIEKSGKIGGTGEHSIADGIEFDHFMENYINMDLNFLTYPEEVVDLDKLKNYKPKATKLAERLTFDISEEMVKEINRCYDEYQLKAEDVDIAARVFRDFGKGLMKKGKCSPDGFMQMAIQLANYKDQGKFSLTYESASVRFYANSRTETLRTVNKDSCAFVRSMIDPNCNDTERLALLRKACETHGYRNRLCMVGKGVDRHLFVLYVLSRATGWSSPFLNHYISQQWLLSTSQAPTMTDQLDEDKDPGSCWLGGCFAAVAKDGYGICYRFAGNHSICIYISSYKSSEKTDSHRFQKTLLECIHQIVKLFEVEGVKL